MRRAPYKSIKEGGVGALLVLLHSTAKEHPCHVCSNSMPSKQTIGQKIRTTEPPVAWKSRHDNTQHSEQHYVCHRELAVCSVLVMSIYVKLLCTMKFLTSDMHGACDYVSQTPRVHSIMHLSMVCPTCNTWGLMGDSRGIDISPYLARAQTCVPPPYTSFTNTLYLPVMYGV